MKKQLYTLAFITSFFASACVSQQKYAQAVQAMESYRSDSAAWAAQVTALRNSISALEEKNAACQQRFDSMRRTNASSVKQVHYHPVRLIQDSAINLLYQELRNHAATSGIIRSVKKDRNQVQVEFRPSIQKNTGILSAEVREEIFKLAEMIKTHGTLEVVPVSNWSDIRGRQGANIGDSAWVGSAGQGREDAVQDNTNPSRKTDSAATAAVGSQPYPGSGAVAMNTGKSNRKSADQSGKEPTKVLMLREFSRHGVFPDQGDTSMEASDKKNQPLRFIIRERIGRGS